MDEFMVRKGARISGVLGNKTMRPGVELRLKNGTAIRLVFDDPKAARAMANTLNRAATLSEERTSGQPELPLAP